MPKTMGTCLRQIFVSRGKTVAQLFRENSARYNEIWVVIGGITGAGEEMVALNVTFMFF